MSREAVLRARGQIAFILGLAIASGFLLWLGRQECVPVSDVAPGVNLLAAPPASADELWGYVERNRDATTGLVNAFDGSGWTTAGDIGHAIKATLAAHHLRLVSGRELYARNAALLRALGSLPTEVATRRIDTRSGQALPDEGGGAGPLVSALELLAWSYPANGREAAAQLERWRTAAGSPVTPVASGESDLARTASALMTLALSVRGEER